MVRYYKKTTVVKEYIQPTATLGLDSGALGVKGGQNLDSYIDQAGEAPKAFNGATATIVKYTGGAAPVFYWIFKINNPSNVILQSITFTCNSGYMQGSNDGSTWVNLDNGSYASGRKTINITQQFTYYRINVNYVNRYKTNYGIYHDTYLSNVVLTGTYTTQDWQPCTKEEYDKLPEEDRKIIREVYILPTVNKYYKKATVVKEYIQPTATLGLDSGALGVIGGQNLDSLTDRTNEAPNAFNGGTATFDKYTNGTVPVFYWIFKINSPSNVTLQSIAFTCNSGYMQGSNDGSTWVNLNNGSFASGRKTINITQRFTYYRINVNYVNRYGTNYGIYHDTYLSNVVLTGTYTTQAWQPCTKEEYVQLPENGRYKVNRNLEFSHKGDYIDTGLTTTNTVQKHYLGGAIQSLGKKTIVKEYIQPTANYGLTGKLAISGGNIQNPYGNILQNNPLNQSSVHNAFNGGSSNLEQYTGGNNPMFQWVCAIGEDVLPILSHITFTTNFNGYVMGSNDRANWVTIPNTDFSSGYHNIVLNTQYKYYCIQATSANGGNATSSGRHYYATLTNVRLYGTYTTQAWQS